MKYALAGLCICFYSTVASQNEVLFKVITYSDGVTIDGAPVTFGMNVSGVDKKVVIPKKGYLGVITKDGEVVEVTTSATASSVIPPRVLRANTTLHSPPSVILYSVGESGQRLLVGDSIFFNWGTTNPLPTDTAMIRFVNKYDDHLVTIKTTSKYAVIGTTKIADKEDLVIFSVSYTADGKPPVSSEVTAIRRDLPKIVSKINFDLTRLPVNDDRLFLESALYLINKAGYDSSWRLYKILKSNKTTADPILTAYYKLMFERYHLADVNLD